MVSPKWTDSSRWRSWNAWGSIVALAAGITLCAKLAEAHGRLVAFDPVNGSFQSFNPVRRLLLGQHLGRDFDSYLGIGPVYLLRFAMAFVRGDFLSSLSADYFVNSFLCFATLACVARLCRVPLALSLALAAALTAITASVRVWWLPTPWTEAWWSFTWAVVAPGNSELGLRGSVTLFAVLAVWLAHRFARVGEPGTARRSAIILGSIAGLAAPWSNDFGPATAATLFATALCFLPRELTRPRLLFALWMIGSGLVAAVLLLSLVTHGAPWSWVEYNLFGVARDQAWYFPEADKLPRHWTPAVIGTLVAVLLTPWLRRSTARSSDALLFLLVAASVVGGVIPNLAHGDERYYLPLYRCLLFVLPYLTIEYAGALRHRLRTPRAAARAHFDIRRAVSTSLVIALFVLALEPVLARDAIAMGAITMGANVIASDEDVEIAELGGKAAASMSKLAAVGRDIRAQAEARGVPQDARIFSTYATALEVVADALQPTGNDYIIHALGPRRARYLDTFLQTRPMYVTTIRADRIPWEPWIRRTNWSFYRELLQRYEPFDQLENHTLWRPRAVELDLQGRDVPIRRAHKPLDLHRTALLIKLAADPAHMKAERQLVDVDIEGVVHWNSPFGLRRGILVIDPEGAGPPGVCGIAPDSTRWRFPVEVTPGKPRRMFLAVQPQDAGKIEIRSMRATLLGSVADLTVPHLERLIASDYTSDIWSHGVARAGERVGFFVFDESDLADVRVGMQLRFRRSGLRTIVELNERTIWIDGEPLDPEHDGYPNWVDIVRQKY